MVKSTGFCYLEAVMIVTGLPGFLKLHKDILIIKCRKEHLPPQVVKLYEYRYKYK